MRSVVSFKLQQRAAGALGALRKVEKQLAEIQTQRFLPGIPLPATAGQLRRRRLALKFRLGFIRAEMAADGMAGTLRRGKEGEREIPGLL